MDIYLVGGAVRDKLLGYPFHEKDWVVVGATPKELLDLGYQPVGSDFPVFLHPETREEYALARTERKTAPGYKGFHFHSSPEVTLQEDLIRRDLTINAIAEDSEGNLVDPYNGKADLDAKLLRHVSDAFVEDPLRVLRVARFAARYHHLGFTIAQDTQRLMTQLANSGELEALTPERVWKETERALAEHSPHIYIQTLRECGALKVLLPEVDALFGIPQRADYHPEIDTGTHTLMALQQAAQLHNDPAIRFAVLVHDLGKGSTPTDILPRHIGHEERGVPLVEALCKRIKAPRRFLQLAKQVTRFHLLCHKAPTLRPITLMKLFNGLDLFRNPDNLQPFLLCCEADARGRKGLEDKPYPSTEWLTNAFQIVAPVSAAQFLEKGLKGTQIGEAIEQQRLQLLANFKEQNPA